MTETPAAPVEEQRTLPAPGQLIRRARTQRQLTLTELASRTRLSVAVLGRLEADDYAALGEPVYARGYYRKCAQALGFNGDVLVAAYEKHSGTGSPVPEIRQRPSIRYREGPGALQVGLIVLLVLGVLAGGWQLISTDDLDIAAQAMDASAPSGVDLPEEEPSGPDADKEAPVEIAETEEALVLAQPPAPAVAQELETPQASAPPPDVAVLEIQVGAGEVWAEVMDRTGARLLYKLLQEGERRALRGQAPYELRFGRADLVTLWLDGQVIDLRPHIQKDASARVRVGQAVDG